MDKRCPPHPPELRSRGRRALGSRDRAAPHVRICRSACLVGSPAARVSTYMCVCIYARATQRVGMLACVNTQSTWGLGAGCVYRVHTCSRLADGTHACTPECTVMCWGPSLSWWGNLPASCRPGVQFRSFQSAGQEVELPQSGPHPPGLPDP